MGWVKDTENEGIGKGQLLAPFLDYSPAQTIVIPKLGSFPRRIPTEYSKQVKAYGSQVGEILWAWNRIQAGLCVCFCTVIESPDAGLILWHQFNTDFAQRQALKAILRTEIRNPAPEQVSEAIEWVIDVQALYAQYRNDAAHGIMAHRTSVSGETRLVPEDTANTTQRWQRLNRADREAFFRKVKGDLVSLSFYVSHIQVAFVLRQQLKTLRKKPPLQAIPQKDVPLTRSQKARREAAHKRRHRRKSSQP